MPAQAFDDPDTSPRPPATNALRRMRPLLGTYVEIALHGPQPGGALTIERAIERAFAAVAQAQRLWSFQDPDSELTRLNRHPWQRVPISPATGRLLRLARALAQLSEGRFNPTLGGRLVAQGALPDHGGPAALPIGNADDLELGVGWARLNRPVRLTLRHAELLCELDDGRKIVEPPEGPPHRGEDPRAVVGLELEIHRALRLQRGATPLKRL